MSNSVPSKTRWSRVAFGDIVRLARERSSNPDRDGFERYIGLEHIDPGDLTIRRWGNVADGTTFTNVFRAGQVLFGKRRAYQRKVGVPDFDGVCSGDIYVFESKSQQLLPELLPFICQTDRFFEHAVGTSAGSLSPRTNWDSLAAFEFSLPPIDEQQRLRDALVASQVASASLNQLLATQINLRRAAIDGLTENDAWPAVTVEDVCSMQNGKAFPGGDYTSDGIPLLRPGNLGADGYLSWDAAKTVRLSDKWERDAVDFIVTPGDVLINLTAQSLEDGFMGRVCLAREGDRSLLNQRIGRFRNWRADVSPEYVFRVLQSSRFQSHAIEMCEGSKVKHIFWPYIGRYLFKLPPRDVQHAVVNSLRQVDRMLDSLRDRLASHRRIHQQLIAATAREAELASTVR
jgi:type I restriction enzyme, S subunit